jgi:hypothetical protein
MLMLASVVLPTSLNAVAGVRALVSVPGLACVPAVAGAVQLILTSDIGLRLQSTGLSSSS